MFVSLCSPASTPVMPTCAPCECPVIPTRPKRTPPPPEVPTPDPGQLFYCFSSVACLYRYTMCVLFLATICVFPSVYRHFSVIKIIENYNV